MAAQANAGDSDAITGINVTPLVDVILVLLIIFMATAPLIARRGLNVNIPKASKSERMATETLKVEFTAKREVVLDGRKMSADSLMSELANMVKHEPALHLALAADQDIPYGEVVGLLDRIRAAGVKKVGLEVKQK